MRMIAKLAAGIALIGAWPCALAQAASAPDAVAYQIDVAHSGNASILGFTGKLKRLWRKEMGGAVSYPLITGGLVIVTVVSSSNTTQIYALDNSTGTIVWEYALGGSRPWSNAAYDNGQVFAVNYDGLVRAFTAGPGLLKWSVQLQGQSAFSSPPTAHNGQLFIGGAGSGGTLYALDEVHGSVEWTAPVQNGDNSSPALGAGGVYVTYPCQYYRFAPTDGQLIWNSSNGCEGAGGRTPVYVAKQLYVRDTALPNAVLDAKTGAPLGTFSATPAPAFFTRSGVRYGVALANGTLTCFDFTTSNTIWSFSGDGELSTAPIAVDNRVIEGSESGELYVLNSKTGGVVWSANVGAPIPAPDEQNVSQPLTGLAAAEGIVAVPAGSLLTVYAPAR